MGYPDKSIPNNKTFKEYQIIFEKNVEEIYGTILDFGADGIVYLFLLDDGSVYYLTTTDIVQNQDFKQKKIEDIDDIVKFVNISYQLEGDAHGRPPTVIAYKSDSTFYDLSKLINIGY